MERLAPVIPAVDRPRPVAHPLPQDCNFIQLLANSPAVTEAYLSYESALAHGQLAPKQREMIALAIAEINGSKYGLSAHYEAAKRAGLTDEEIRQARKASSPDLRHAAMLRFTRAVALQRGEVNDADFNPLRQAGFTDAEITEIVANIALNIFTNYFNSMARTVVDFPLLRPGEDAPSRLVQKRNAPDCLASAESASHEPSR